MSASPSPAVPPADSTQVYESQIVIVGAGPVGLFLALKLSLKGIKVLVLEAENAVLQSPRATTFVTSYLSHRTKG